MPDQRFGVDPCEFFLADSRTAITGMSVALTP